MEFIGLLAPIAFVFGIAAYSQVSSLKKDVEALKVEVQQLKSKQ